MHIAILFYKDFNPMRLRYSNLLCYSTNISLQLRLDILLINSFFSDVNNFGSGVILRILALMSSIRRPLKTSQKESIIF